MVLPRISNVYSLVNVYFTDTENIHCMHQWHAMHVPSVNEIYHGSGLCIINPGENYAINVLTPQTDVNSYG